MGFGGLSQRELLVGKRAQFVGGPERPYLLPQRRNDRRLLVDGARTQGRAGYRQMFALDQPEIGLDPVAPHQCHKAQPALMRQKFELTRDVIAADHVDDCIYSAAVGEVLADCDEILRTVVDRDIRTEAAVSKDGQPATPSFLRILVELERPESNRRPL